MFVLRFPLPACAEIRDENSYNKLAFQIQSPEAIARFVA